MEAADTRMHRPDRLSSPVTLGVLDDHEVLLDSLDSWIDTNAPDFALTLRAQTWLELVNSPAFPTNLILIDFQLKEPISIEARVRTCHAAGSKVIVFSSFDTREARERAREAGAAEFLSKSSSMSDLMNAARTVMGMPTVASKVAPLRIPKSSFGTHRPKLSEGELRALRLYSSGLSTIEVAKVMGVKYETAKTYLRRVREKYQKVSRPAGKKTDLIRRAAEDGYLQ